MRTEQPSFRNSECYMNLLVQNAEAGSEQRLFEAATLPAVRIM
jgi:hypothetical protein